MGKRLFLAVRPPPAVTDELEAYIGPRREAEPALGWAQPEHWHLTLAFLGDVSDAQQDGLIESLAAVASRTDRFALTLRGGGCAPHPDAAKVLWMGVGEGSGPLEALAKRCRTAAVRVGIPIEGGRFQPHLTVARSNRGIAVLRWLELFDTFGAFTWRVTDVVLIDSELTRGGPRHRVAERFDLTGSEMMPR